MWPASTGNGARACVTHSTCPTTATRVIARLGGPAGGGRLGVGREHGQERLLWHLDRAHLLHALLALLLLLEQLALARDVAAVALGQDVLALRLDGLAGDDARADRGLDRDVVLLARDLRLELLRERAADLVRLVAVD